MDQDAIELEQIVAEERKRHSITPDGKMAIEYSTDVKRELENSRRWSNEIASVQTIRGHVAPLLYEQRQPVPTEYSNIVFRSKSEAVFARSLDLARQQMWFYEPENVSSCHQWDFQLYHRCGCRHCKGRVMLIEYKPSQPTMTYVRELTERVRGDVEASGGCWDSYIVWGNPWDGPAWNGQSYVCYPVFSKWSWKYGWGDFEPLADSGEDRPVSHRHDTSEILGITESMAQAAKKYRFDLKQ